MAQRRTGARSSRRKGGHDSTYETYDQVVAGILLMDGLSLLSAERRGDQVVFVFQSRRGLAGQVREITKIGRGVRGRPSRD
jgi:hypothetical protein